ncbi:hypothetical protein TNCV_3611451 [Trichonephila clavipes]|nr:hypothetical protein TNCV_3611451 [Trichonephila clavipes]
MFRIVSKQRRSITPIKRYGRDIRIVMVKNACPFLFLSSLPMKNYHRVEQVKSVRSQSPHVRVTWQHGDYLSLMSEARAPRREDFVEIHASENRENGFPGIVCGAEPEYEIAFRNSMSVCRLW